MFNHDNIHTLDSSVETLIHSKEGFFEVPAMDLASQTVTLVTEALSLRRGSYLWYVFASGCSSVALLVLKKMATVGLRAIEDYRLKGRHDRVIIFSRYPVPGKSKTRLIPLLGQRGASTCQLRMVSYLALLV